MVDNVVFLMSGGLKMCEWTKITFSEEMSEKECQGNVVFAFLCNEILAVGYIAKC